ncbi:kinase-like domain-containing protein [Suillus lakei]|nr:kinase-like domain-containing protein [Suillus lakei]
MICRYRSSCGGIPGSGYMLLGLPIPDAKSFSVPQLPSGLIVDDRPAPLSDLFNQNHSIFSGLLERCRVACGTVEKTQVLVVTSSPYQVMESANMACFPTVLVQRPGDLGSGVNIRTSDPTLLVDGLQALPKKLQNTSLVHCPSPPRMQPHVGGLMPLRVRGMHQMTKLLGTGSSGRVTCAFHVLTGSEVCVTKVYSLLRGHPGIPSSKWSGLDRGSGELPWKTVVMIGVQMFNRVEFAHSRGVVLLDIKPEIFAMGIGEKSHIVYLFDFGLAKLYVDPSTGTHIPYLANERGAEQKRQDDLGALSNVLLYLLHGRLPWVDICASSKEAKLHRMGEMKASSAAFRDLLARSPAEFTTYFDRCRGLKFEDKPNYALLRQLFSRIMEREEWTGDTRFDPLDGSSDKGTLVAGEYKMSDLQRGI